MIKPTENNLSFEHLFRHSYGKIVAVLANKYSSKNFDLIEDAVQDALLKAMNVWPYHQYPDNPTAWLYRVAQNILIDNLRKLSKSITIESVDIDLKNQKFIAEEEFADKIKDNQLKMIFACCHSELNDTEKIVLSLKFLCGMNIREISRALIKNEESIKKTLFRAKKKIQAIKNIFEMPSNIDIQNRLTTVLKIIYLLFNEGYKATDGEQLIKKDVCEEAIRLALILHDNKQCNIPELNALLSLMCFNTSRFDARLDKKGNLVTLENQDKNKWDQEYITWGMYFLQQSSNGANFSEYHLEAGIASYYATSKSFEKTNWQAILNMYDMLLKIKPTPMVALNRLVVLAKVNGVETALHQLSSLENKKQLMNNYLLYSIKADFKISLKCFEDARSLLKKAVALSSNNIEKNYLENKLINLPEN